MVDQQMGSTYTGAMSSEPSIAGEVHALFERASQPIYVVDERRRLVFLNRACAEWLGVGPDDLLGRECRYHSVSAAEYPDALVAALCPPPEALAGRPASGTIVVPAASHAAQPHDAEQRNAVFVPLSVGDKTMRAVVVLVERPGAREACIGEEHFSRVSQVLHERLAEVRRQWGGRYTIDRLLGTSPAIERARKQAMLASGSDVAVLIVGPAGSGRQHVARTIHLQRWDEPRPPLVPLACSLLGADLLQSTLEALARSDAAGPTSGGRGTLLLNEVDQLPVELQRVLSENLVGRFPLRVMATSHRRLEELVAEGTFDERLACALGTLVIELPPLADRSEDVELLAQAALEEQNAAGEKQLQGFSEEAMDRLVAYAWPGNVDELFDVVRQAHREASGPLVEEPDLPLAVRMVHGVAPRPRETTIVLDNFLREIEIELIQRAMQQSKGNKAKAARLLGMTRPRLYRRLEQLGLAESTGS